MNPYPSLMPGDIVGVKNRGIMGWLSEKLMVPHTELYHFLLIGDYLPWDDDYVILESISKGIAVGRLSFYRAEDIMIFRRVLPEDDELIRKKAAAALTLKGRARYDFLLILQILLSLPQLIMRGKFPPYHPEELPYGKNKAYICTEAVAFAWEYVRYPIISRNIAPVPSAIIKSFESGILKQIYP